MLVRGTGIESVSGEYEVRLVPVFSLLTEHAANRGPAHTQRDRDSVIAMVPADSPLACIRCARAAFDLSSFLGRPIA